MTGRLWHDGVVLMLNPLGRSRSIDGFPLARGAFPAIGHIPALATDGLAFIREAERRHGPLFFVETGFGSRMLVCARPDAFDVFMSKVASSGYMREGAVGEMFGSAVITQDGAVHHRMRAVLNGPFTPRGLSAAEVGPLVAQIMERRARRFMNGEPVRVLAETRELALDVIFRVVGIEDEELGEWRERYEEALLLFVNLPLNLPGTPHWRGRRGKAWIDGRLLESIRAARKRPPGSGLLSALVHGRGAEGETLSDGELVDNLRLVMLAGHETSASTMAWIMGLFAERRSLWERVSEEVRAFGRIPVSPADLRQLPFTEAVFREVLRLYPPVTNDARRTTGHLELCGRAIPKGTQVGIPILHLSRHRDLHDRPDELLPERWLDRKKRITPLELMQFGGGPHFCLGYHLAWMEIMQLMAALALAAGERGLRPRLVGAPPAPRYLPLLHPSASTRVVFDAR